MGLWQILKGEQPGLLKSVLHYRNAGQFGEYLIDYALQSNGIEGERVVLTNLYLPMKGKTTEIDLLMLHEKGIFVIESKYYSGRILALPFKSALMTVPSAALYKPRLIRLPLNLYSSSFLP